jgi:hypothetical protein
MDECAETPYGAGSGAASKRKLGTTGKDQALPSVVTAGMAATGESPTSPKCPVVGITIVALTPDSTALNLQSRAAQAVNQRPRYGLAPRRDRWGNSLR